MFKILSTVFENMELHDFFLNSDKNIVKYELSTINFTNKEPRKNCKSRHEFAKLKSIHLLKLMSQFVKIKRIFILSAYLEISLKLIPWKLMHPFASKSYFITWKFTSELKSSHAHISVTLYVKKRLFVHEEAIMLQKVKQKNVKTSRIFYTFIEKSNCNKLYAHTQCFQWVPWA